MAITVTLKTNGGLDASQSSYQTASVNLVAGKLYLLSVFARPDLPTGAVLSGVTWDAVDGIAGGTAGEAVRVYRCVPSANTSGQITINFASAQSRCAWSVVEVDGSSAATGDNGAGAVLQSRAQEIVDVVQATFSLLNPVQSASNLVFCAPVHGGNDTATPETGWTQLAHDTIGTDWDRINSTTNYQVGSDNSYTEDWGFNSGVGVILEIAAGQAQSGNISGAISSSAVYQAVIAALGILAGSTQGNAALSSTATGSLALGGACASVSTFDAALVASASASGTVTAQSSFDAFARGTAPIVGSLASASGLSGFATSPLYAAGQILAASELAGRVFAPVDAVGVIASASTCSALVQGNASLIGAVTTSGSLAAVLVGYGSSSGSIGSTSTFAGQIAPLVLCSGSMDATSLSSGSLVGHAEAVGAMSCASTVAAFCRGDVAIVGLIESTCVLSGVLRTETTLAGVIQPSSVVVASLSADGDLSGAMPGMADIAAQLQAYATAAGNLAGLSLADATLAGAGALGGQWQASCAFSGLLRIEAPSLAGNIQASAMFAVVANGTANVVARLGSVVEISATLAGDGALVGQVPVLSSCSATVVAKSSGARYVFIPSRPVKPKLLSERYRPSLSTRYRPKLSKRA